jgi:hypothetical protein
VYDEILQIDLDESIGHVEPKNSYDHIYFFMGFSHCPDQSINVSTYTGNVKISCYTVMYSLWKGRTFLLHGEHYSTKGALEAWSP